MTFLYLQIDKHRDVEEEGEQRDGDEVEAEVLPAGRAQDVDPVLVRVADGKVALEGESHNGQAGGAHGDLGGHLQVFRCLLVQPSWE